MSEHDHDVLLRGAFDQFRQDVLPYVHRAGASAAIGTARARRRARIATVTAIVVVALGVPAVVFGATRGGPDQNPQPGGSTPAVTPSVTSAPSVSPTPSTTPAPVTTTPATTGAGELANALLPVDWSWIPRPVGAPSDVPDPLCTSGSVQFANGAYLYPQLYGQRIASVARADVDHDGTMEIIALLECQWAQAPDSQIVAFRPTSGGYTALGAVARSNDDIQSITEFGVDSNGAVLVRVANGFACCGNPESAVTRQWRGYAWNGSAFTQVSGATTFD